MTTAKQSLLAETQAHVETQLRQLPAEYTYHNLEHTQSVVLMTTEIGAHEGLSAEDLETAKLAAWFHDIGYLETRQNHEAVSVTMARAFLSEQNVPEARIDQITACIEATRTPQKPGDNKLAQVLCDADMAHLAGADYFDKAEALRQEIKSLSEKIKRRKWAAKSVKFMEKHQYFTSYGKEILDPRKADNLKKLKEQVEQDEKEKAQAEKAPDTAKPADTPEEVTYFAKPKKPERGIETMFRVTSQNHLQLSAMADNKANIMISINTIIVSLILSILLPRLDRYPDLAIPTTLLTITCVSATVLAILATRPNVSEGRFTKEDIESKSANLLFFGNFHQMQLADYEWGMREMMNDANFLYSSMTRDIYYLGKVLGRKYKLLRYSYTVFMFGFVLSVIAFGVFSILSGDD